MSDYNLSEERRNLLSSNMAYDILSVMLLSEDEMYSKEIKEELEYRNYNTSNASVSNYIKQLRDFGLVERGKRTKAQYYHVNVQGLYSFWANSISKILEQISSTLDQPEEEIIDEINDKEEFTPQNQEELDLDEILNVLREHTQSWSEDIVRNKENFEEVSESNNLQKFVISYFVEVVEKLKMNKSLYSVLVKDLLYQLIIANAHLGEDNFPDELKDVIWALLSVDATGEVNFDVALDSIRVEYFEEIAGISKEEVYEVFDPEELNEKIDELYEELPEDDKLEAIDEKLAEDISKEKEILLRFLKVRIL